MSKLLLVSDSACDISPEIEAAHNSLKILNLPLHIDGKEVLERVGITPQQYYEVLNTCTELPTHAALNMQDFVAAYTQAAKEGVTDFLYLAINGRGSSTYNTAVHAKAMFAEESPHLARGMQIYLVDGRCYSLGNGLPLLLAAEMAEQGKGAAEIVSYLTEYIRYRAEYVAFGTLKFAKRSGRIGAAAAFAGELLGLKPVMGFPNGVNTVHTKVRGEKAVVSKLFELYKETVASETEPYAILHGADATPARELAALIQGYNGLPPYLMGEVGPCVATNAGPQVVGIIFRSKIDNGYDAPVR